MSYAGIQMFMDKLNHLINSHHIPSINNPDIICERPQFQWLYDELASIIQTLFIHQHEDLQQLIDLKQRFILAAEEAEYNVDLFLSSVRVRNNSHDPTSSDFNRSLNLDDVRISLIFIKAELKILDSSPRPQTTTNQSAAAAQSSISRESKKLMDEIFVGIDRDAELIRDKLVEDQKKLDVVSIVGMGGIGKTTLASKVFNDGFVKYHFHVRVWVTVSQTYDKRAVLTQILKSIPGQLNLKEANDSRLRELVHKNLMGKRYLIVVDDIWDIETWDKVKVFFPHDNNGSRILLTSRLTEVARHACLDGLIHHLGCLNKEKCWKLLSEKVFHGSVCPTWSIKPGMKIVESCQGLPLAVVVIAGVLAREAWSKTFWEEISYKMGSYLFGDENGCIKTLALSYNHLPLHLRECFLYLGGFPEDYVFKIRELIWFWMAEGFIHQDGNRRLEDTAEGYLMDLIDRNLVSVDRWKSNGGVKACKVHDLIRELCLKKAKDEGFLRKIERLTLSSQLTKVKKPPYMPERMFIYKAFAFPSTQNCRSVLFFGYVKLKSWGDDNAKLIRSFLLLRVLDLQECELNDLPKGMELLVHLRYLAIQISSTAGFPDSICNLWNLQTLILYTKGYYHFVLPSNISDLVNLRHLRTYPLNVIDRKGVFVLPSIKGVFVLPSIERPMRNLQTISKVKLADGVDNFQKCIPYIKKLTCFTKSEKKNDFKSLIYLENLNLTNDGRRMNSITFPATLKTLTLLWCHLQWSEMLVIQSLPNLQVLKLHSDAFSGSYWNTDGQEFPQLQFLTLLGLNIKEWEAYSRSFPCLRQLQILHCRHLKEIPLEIGDIPTLELIQINECRRSVFKSLRRIEKEQHDLGNYHLKIDTSPIW